MSKPLPQLVRVYIRQCLIGFAIAAAFVALLLGLDVGGLRGLIGSTSGGWIALFMLWFANGLVFAGVQFAITIMGMAEPRGQGPGARLREWVRRGEPVRIAVAKDEKAAGPQRP